MPCHTMTLISTIGQTKYVVKDDAEKDEGISTGRLVSGLVEAKGKGSGTMYGRMNRIDLE